MPSELAMRIREELRGVLYAVLAQDWVKAEARIDESIAPLLAENERLKHSLEVFVQWKRSIEQSGDRHGWATAHESQAANAALRQQVAALRQSIELCSGSCRLPV